MCVHLQAQSPDAPDVWYQLLASCCKSRPVREKLLEQEAELLQRLQRQPGLDTSLVHAAVEEARMHARLQQFQTEFKGRYAAFGHPGHEPNPNIEFL